MFEASEGQRPYVVMVAAARPNFMKVGPVIMALRSRAEVALVHAGQHYDREMSNGFLAELGLPAPKVNLGVGSGTHAEQTAAVMVAFERYLVERPPDAVVVVGDVNSTLGCALAAVKLRLPVAHVEAGLRSGDWSMPEEVNRVLTDRISRWLFAPSADAVANLAAEGIDRERVHLVGNVMIDTLTANLESARARGRQLQERWAPEGRYGVLTLHRPSNVDDATSLRTLLEVIATSVGGLPLLFPVHPRTAARIAEFGIELPRDLMLLEPLGYLDFIGLLDGARLVLTDSGGVQEEATVLGVPCVTLRDTTERPVTCELGTNRVAGTHPDAVRVAIADALTAPQQAGQIPLWDGAAGPRVAEVLLADLIEKPGAVALADL